MATNPEARRKPGWALLGDDIAPSISTSACAVASAEA
jgi:hypothetical protein